MDLTERIEQRMAVLSLNPFSTAKRANLHQDYVRDILRGRVKQPGAARLMSLAGALECSLEYLLGTSDEVGLPPRQLSASANQAIAMRVRQRIRPGYHDEDDDLAFQAESIHWILPKYPQRDEWLEEIVSDRAAIFEPGTFLHVTEATDPVHGDWVIVKQARGELVQRAPRQLFSKPDGWYFIPAPPRLEHSLWSIDDLTDGTLPDGLSIEGRIVGAYRWFS